MALKSTQPLTEINFRNLPGVKDGRRVKLTSPSVNPLCGRYDSLNFSQPYGLHGLLQGSIHIFMNRNEFFPFPKPTLEDHQSFNSVGSRG
jgi:hypothetical protein